MTIEWAEIGEEELYSELDANTYINWLKIPENNITLEKNYEC